MKDIELAEASSAAMRAILQRLVQVRTNIVELNQLTCDNIQPMLDDVHQCVSTSVRVNMIRMLCNLVQIMLNRKDSKHYEVIKVIIFMFFGFSAQVSFYSNYFYLAACFHLLIRHL